MVSVISFLTNFLLENQFKYYIMEQQEQNNKEIVFLITQQYKDDSAWNSEVIENIGLNALEQGLIVKVTDRSDNVIWDATLHNNGLCMQMISHMAQNMNSRYPNFKGGYQVSRYPVVKNINQVGTVEVGYYGPFYSTDNDLRFINTLNNALLVVGILSLLFALALGAFMARRLSKPISQVIGAAEQISKGYFGDRIAEKSGTKEIHQLTGTINNLAETLEKQEMLRKRMAADVAHELRTPLATLQSHMEALIDGIWKPGTERFKSCHEEILRINRMVGDLEKLAKFESDNLVLDKTEFNLGDLFRRIIQNFETEFKNKNIKLYIDTNEVILFADVDKISQVLINLISNALKYTPDGGMVKASAKENEASVEISVKDKGIGITPEDLPYIFERFYRADKSRNRLTGGSGIGLTITKTIVEAHKGNMTVKSELGKGTEFIVTLPKVKKVI
jgi:signal transduction histidine kinase